MTRKTETPLRVAFWLFLVWVTPKVLEAQSGSDRRLEVFVSVGKSGTSRYDDKGFGRHADVGVGATVLLGSGFAVQLEAARVYGLHPTPCRQNEPCGATTSSATVLLEPSASRVRPYLMFGILALRSETAASDYSAGSGATRRVRETGVGPLIGAGMMVLITRRYYVQPSWWIATAPFGSHINLNASRASLAAGYRW